jgi:hypothetical protein
MTVITLGLMACSLQAQSMREGKWEITVKAEMSGVPVPMPAQKMTVCIDAKNQGKPPIGADSSCKFSNLKSSGNSMSWRMECNGDTKLSGDGMLTFNGDSYSGNANMKIDMGDGESMTIKNSYSGRRLGGC